jgi:hypothetical protein
VGSQEKDPAVPFRRKFAIRDFNQAKWQKHSRQINTGLLFWQNEPNFRQFDELEGSSSRLVGVEDA